MALTETDFENAIEAHLIGTNGYKRLDPKVDWDVEKAICPAEVVSFIKESQPAEWKKLAGHYGANAESAVVDEILRQIKEYGMLYVLRNGITDRGVSFKVVQFKPASGMNPDLKNRYDQNQLGIMRQVRFDPATNQTIDTVLFVNGLPVATIELKNAYTGQTVLNAIKQYIKDRKPNKKTPLIDFNTRALVHFALDTSECWMTTRLSGNKTYFLPFNQGNDGRKGNPVSKSGGHRTAYMWESVWEKDAWLNIFHRFVHLEQIEKQDKDGKKRIEKRLIFPRYHQWDCVTRLVKTSREEGPGQNYLNQHSAGSGKTNTIAWTAHQLASLHNDDDKSVFDGVIVISDRTNLDQQLQETVFGIEHKQGLVACITNKKGSKSDQLRKELDKGTRIIVSTLQTFMPLVDKDGEDLSAKNYAVIVDEAHSSQTGKAAAGVRRSLGAEGHDDEDEADLAERIANMIKQRGPQPNISFYAFTATPKPKTIEMFGRAKGGKKKEFSLYSMRQAIDEGFIMDVLKGYVTYEEHYNIAKAIDDDPTHDKKRSKSQILKYASLHESAVNQKVAIIIEHFREHVQHKLGGEAKAMVVTRSRLHAVKYKLAMDAYIADKHYGDLKTLVAFSGKVLDKETDIEYTESGMNKISEDMLPEEFSTPEYQLLLVAEKYQTGFDQPLLHTMYVDKALDGVKAVQTLSRLNRCHPLKRDTCVVDFVNDRETIYNAFKDYYHFTTIDKPTDPNAIYKLQLEIAKSGIIYDSDVESFAEIFFQKQSEKDDKTHGRLDALIQPAVERFVDTFGEGRDEEQQKKGMALKKAIRSFLRLYEFVTQLYSYPDSTLEKLYAYNKALLPALPYMSDGEDEDITGEIDLKAYRAEKLAEADILLDDGKDPEPLKGGTGGGGGTGKTRPDMAPLSQIVAEFNERFGYNLAENDLAVIEQVEIDAEADEVLVKQAENSSPHEFSTKFAERVVDLFMDRQNRNADFFNIIMSDDDARSFIVKEMLGAFLKKHGQSDGATQGL